MAPRWLRFARALALVGGVAACGGAPASEPGGSSTNGGTSSGGATTGGGTSGPPIATTDPCPCTCDASSTNPPYCGVVGHWECCEAMVVEGPLPPPDLPT